MARRPKQKMLTALPVKFRPDFIDRLNRNYALARWLLACREELRAHVGGHPSCIQERLIARTLWQEVLILRYEQQIANGDQVDVGAITQLSNTLKGLYKDLGHHAAEVPGRRLRDVMQGAA